MTTLLTRAQQLSDEELNREIATWMGFEWRLANDSSCVFLSEPGTGDFIHAKKPTKEQVESLSRYSYGHIPNYCRDLNACREAELKLKEEQYEAFYQALFDSADTFHLSKSEAAPLIFSPDARIRAEALWATIKEESPK